MLSDFLSTTVLPVDALNCNVSDCTEHRNELESYYADVVLSMLAAAKLTIPSVKFGVEKHLMPLTIMPL